MRGTIDQDYTANRARGLPSLPYAFGGDNSWLAIEPDLLGSLKADANHVQLLCIPIRLSLLGRDLWFVRLPWIRELLIFYTPSHTCNTLLRSMKPEMCTSSVQFSPEREPNINNISLTKINSNFFFRRRCINPIIYKITMLLYNYVSNKYNLFYIYIYFFLKLVLYSKSMSNLKLV